MTAFNALFDEQVYLSQYPDVAAAVRAQQIPSGKQHFLTAGIREGRTAISRFYSAPYRETEYRQAYPDVDRAIRSGALASGLQHYIQSGGGEGRNLFPQGFDEKWYQNRYPDVATAIDEFYFSSGLEHYLRFGRNEQRSVSPFFEFDYFGIYPDIKAARDSGGSFLSAWDHFNTVGKNEGRIATFSGTKRSDLVVGSAAFDTLTGVELDVGSCFIGRSLPGGLCKEYDSTGTAELDTLVGGPGVDTFELGRAFFDASGPRFESFYLSPRDQDFARIQNFEVGKDRLVMGTRRGQAGFSAFGSEFVGTPEGVYIYATPPGSGASPMDRNLVAIVEGVADPSDVLGSTTFLATV